MISIHCQIFHTSTTPYSLITNDGQTYSQAIKTLINIKEAVMYSKRILKMTT